MLENLHMARNSHASIAFLALNMTRKVSAVRASKDSIIRCFSGIEVFACSTARFVANSKLVLRGTRRDHDASQPRRKSLSNAWRVNQVPNHASQIKLNVRSDNGNIDLGVKDLLSQVIWILKNNIVVEGASPQLLPAIAQP